MMPWAGAAVRSWVRPGVARSRMRPSPLPNPSGRSGAPGRPSRGGPGLRVVRWGAARGSGWCGGGLGQRVIMIASRCTVERPVALPDTTLSCALWVVILVPRVYVNTTFR